jgi:putative hydrolase
LRSSSAPEGGAELALARDEHLEHHEPHEQAAHQEAHLDDHELPHDELAHDDAHGLAPGEPHEIHLRLHAPPTNRAVAEKLREVADLLEQQGASARRAEGYRAAALTVDGLDEPMLTRLERGGRAAIELLPNIGPSLGAAIDEMLRTGRFAMLERLRGAAAPERLFCAIPGVGPTLARRIHDRLHIDTLEGLELAAHDGTLEAVAGMGPRRVRALQMTLAALLARVREPPQPAATVEPTVSTLLDVDAEYRRRAERGDLPRIAPKRFNPDGRAWLPILHSERGGWHFTACYSNTARAHQLAKTHDWVLLYFHDDRHPERQRTVVTESRGMLSGYRVIRGREDECERLHTQTPQARQVRRF